MSKTYTEPEFTFVKIDASAKVFCAASGGPTPGPTAASLPDFMKVGGSW